MPGTTSWRPVHQASPALAGEKVLYVPEARVLHRVPASRMRFGRFVSRCYFEDGSKAVVSRLAGASDALASSATTSGGNSRPGIRCGLMDAIARGRVSGWQADRAARRRGWSGQF
jgi:hypothetical protein